MIFSDILAADCPQAAAWVTGAAEVPTLSGMVKFYETPYGGVLVEAEVFGLPYTEEHCVPDFYAMHIHEYGVCTGQNGENDTAFSGAGGHYNPGGCSHPAHAGDLPVLLANQGYAWTAFYDKRFQIRDIIGKSVIIHGLPDDFHTQPAGGAGERIGCGVIRWV